MYSGLRVGVYIGGNLSIAVVVHLCGPLHYSAVEHGRVALHHVIVAPVRQVDAVLPQQWLHIVDEQVHDGDVAGLGAAVVGVQVHGAVAVEDDPRGDWAVVTVQQADSEG